MGNKKKYWKSEVELSSDNNTTDHLKNNEFIDQLPADPFLSDKNRLEQSSTNRRDFLKYLGFSTAAATLASCEGPVNRSIPYVLQPERIIPGLANYYATTIADGFDFANVLVKTREGRPIKIENNSKSKVRCSANARVHASVLSMYDNMRIKTPTFDGKETTWDNLNKNMTSILESMKDKNSPIALLTQTFASPSTSKIISDFLKKYPNVFHVVYDSISDSKALDAFQIAYGFRALPTYDFSNAEYIVSVGADFLGDWQGGDHDSGYVKGRIPERNKDGKANMSKHIQIESNMTITGSNADMRIPLSPSQQKVALAKIFGYISGKDVGGELPSKLDESLKKISQDLKKAGSKGILVTGIDDVNAHLITHEINHLLNSQAFKKDELSLLKNSDDKKITKLIENLNKGLVKGIIMAGVNPVYTLPESKDFISGLSKAEFSICFSMKNDETASLSKWVAASPHSLESWGDNELVYGKYNLTQPTIRPLFDTKQFQDCLLNWIGSSQSFYEFIKDNWQKNILNNLTWNQVLHDGFYDSEIKQVLKKQFINPLERAKSLSRSKSNGIEMVLYTKTGLGDGQQANNPWLQEFPDPITRVSWDNYLTVSKKDADKIGLKNYNVANGALDSNYALITVDGESLKVPVIIQPGQALGSVGLAFGYGKTKALKSEMQVGVNAYNLYKNFNLCQNVKIQPLSENHEFACVQLHNTLMGRGDIIKETTLEVFNTKEAKNWNSVPKVSLNHIETPVTSPDVDLWDEFDRSIGHHFNLSIDLNACTGCGACVIACHAENNVPVVGKEEVRKSRDMHWLRIDRYYSSEKTFEDDIETKENISGISDSLSVFGEMEKPADNPQVVFQPVMCQHCNHAPCETVCPVAATSHGRQGQNHMAYNRCIGTRYCANNCPYKVRRFNWFLYNNNDEFDFNMNNDLGKMVLNPDVVVRSRGVMEKCSFCIQSTQAVILKAKNEGRQVNSGEFNDACACSAACSTGAMKFGDINDKESEVAALKEKDRVYHLLEYVGTKPNVFYHVKVRNTDET